MRGGGTPGVRVARALAWAILLIAPALWPVPAAAVVRYQPAPAARLLPAYAARPAPATVTVDHPPADNVGSFDSGSAAGRKVALTFDADMTPAMLAQLRAGQVRSWYNQELRDLLDSEHVRSTIFLTGLWAESYPDVARSLAQDPNFEIGNHTYDHPAFRLPCYALGGTGERGWEISHSQDVIAQVTGVRPALLRFPGDCYDRSDVTLANERGVLVISGDVRAGDGFNGNPAGIAATVLNQLRPGSIVVMHFQGGPNAPMTAPAVRLIIQAARERGLEFGTVSEVLGRTAVAPQPAPVPAADILAHLRRAILARPPVLAAQPGVGRYRNRPLSGPQRPHLEFLGGLLG